MRDNFYSAVVRILKLAPKAGDEEVMKIYDRLKDESASFTCNDCSTEPLKSGAFIARLDNPAGLF